MGKPLSNINLVVNSTSNWTCKCNGLFHLVHKRILITSYSGKSDLMGKWKKIHYLCQVEKSTFQVEYMNHLNQWSFTLILFTVVIGRCPPLVSSALIVTKRLMRSIIYTWEYLRMFEGMHILIWKDLGRRLWCDNTLACNAWGNGLAPPLQRYVRDSFLECRSLHGTEGRKLVCVTIQEFTVMSAVITGKM